MKRRVMWLVGGVLAAAVSATAAAHAGVSARGDDAIVVASTKLWRIFMTLAAASLLVLPALPALAVPGANLSVKKSDSPDRAVAGSNINYSIGVKNGGPATATGASLSDTTPTNTTFVSLTAAAGWTCTTPPVGGTGAVSCTNPSVVDDAAPLSPLS